MTSPAATFEEMIKGYRVTFWPERPDVVEDMRFPPMRTIFRAEEQRLGRCPTQTDFQTACVIAWPTAFPRHLETAICARLARAYASLVRERHFGLMLAEVCSEVGLSVRDSDDLDLRQGIDYLVSRGVAQVGVAVRQGTARSREYAVRKARSSGRPVVVAELDGANRHELGDFWLYRPEWVRAFVERELMPLLAQP